MTAIALNVLDAPAASARPARDGASAPEAPPLPADDLLIDRLLAGDEAAFEVLLAAYSAKMLRLARSFVSSQAVAEEVLQETWVAVLRGLHRFERRSSLRTWLFRILSNRAKTRGVREGRTVPFAVLADADGRPPELGRYRFDGAWRQPPAEWDVDTPEQLALRAEVRRVVESAVAELPDKQRAVITLRDLDLVSSQETCNILEIGETYQRVLLHRARTRIRGAVAAYLHGEGDADLSGSERARD